MLKLLLISIISLVISEDAHFPKLEAFDNAS